MAASYNVLIMGASYGSLLGSKLLLAGHSVALVCTAETAALINSEGTFVRLPVKGRQEMVSVESALLGATLHAATPQQVEVAEYDLAVLAMQEPQFGSPGVRELLDSVALAKIPCMAIMNMPPPPYLARLPGIDPKKLEHCYTHADIWQNFDPDLLTLASPDPQAFRPPDEAKNVLQVSLPTNFKLAGFTSAAHTRMMQQLQVGIENIEFALPEGGLTALPVKLKVFESLYVPLAKWSMLITGNYRCIGKHEMRSISESVHADLDQSRAVYQWVVNLCQAMGADAADMVPFDKYANAAIGLSKPSSAARALFGGAPDIERVDCLVKSVAAQYGMQLDVLDEIVGFVDARLAANRV